MSIMDTGFASESQEKYLMMNEPSLYKAVLKKHGSFGKRKNPNIHVDKRSAVPNIIRGRGRK